MSHENSFYWFQLLFLSFKYLFRCLVMTFFCPMSFFATPETYFLPFLYEITIPFSVSLFSTNEAGEHIVFPFITRVWTVPGLMSKLVTKVTSSCCFFTCFLCQYFF